jgi:putative acetyltransferase
MRTIGQPQSSVTAVREEQPTDHATIAALHRAAFGGDYEATLVDALRRDGLVLAGLVAVEADKVVGHIMLSALRLAIDGLDVSCASLAPLAVAPGFQRRGHGSLLVKEGIRAVRARGCDAMIVLGHPDYYRRFGFSADLTRHLTAPFGGPDFMGLELSPGVLAGRRGSVTYPAAFGVSRSQTS